MMNYVCRMPPYPRAARPEGASRTPDRASARAVRARDAVRGATLAVLVAVAVTAWDCARAARPDPSDAEAGVPEFSHRTPFEGYRPHRVERIDQWRAVNDEVGRIGGWRAYAREAAAADPTGDRGARGATADAAARPAASQGAAPAGTPAAPPAHPKH